MASGSYNMFDIFYHNTNGDSFEGSSLATAGFEIHGDLISYMFYLVIVRDESKFSLIRKPS